MKDSKKKEESARKLVQNDFAAMTEEIRQVKLESGSTVCSEASTAVGNCASGTFARPPPGIAARLNVISLSQERWNFKAGSLTTKDAVWEGSRPMR